MDKEEGKLLRIEEDIFVWDSSVPLPVNKFGSFLLSFLSEKIVFDMRE